MHFFLNVKAHFHARKFSTDRKSSENIIVKSWKFSLQNIFSDKKFVSANHILQIFLSAENFLEWKWALITVLHPWRKYSCGYRAFKSSVTDDIIINRSFIFTDITGWFHKCITCNTKGYEPNISITKSWLLAKTEHWMRWIGSFFQNSLPADSFIKYKTKNMHFKADILGIYTKALVYIYIHMNLWLELDSWPL
jgi:hypothetical protein